MIRSHAFLIEVLWTPQSAQPILLEGDLLNSSGAVRCRNFDGWLGPRPSPSRLLLRHWRKRPAATSAARPRRALPSATPRRARPLPPQTRPAQAAVRP